MTEVAREGDCARVPEGPQGGLPQIGARLDATELRRLDQPVPVEERNARLSCPRAG